MHGPTIYFILLLGIIEGVSGWSVDRLLYQLVPVFKKKVICYSYRILTVGAIVMTLASRWLHSMGFPVEVIVGAFVWLIALLCMLPFLALLQSVVYVRRKYSPRLVAQQQSESRGLTRRDFLRNSAAVIPIVALGVSASGAVQSANICIQRHELVLEKFPQVLQNFKILQISDAHIGPFFGIAKLDQVIAMVQQEKPDMVVITGDLIDDLALIEPTIARLSKLQAVLPYGMYFCWGNHEYFRDIAQIRRALAQSPIVVLDNKSQLIVDGEQPFYIAGVDYPWGNNEAEQSEKRKLYMKKALENVPEKACTLLLSHHPDFITNAFETGIPLTLAGHTHGGQVGLFGRPLLPLSYKFMRGLYEKDRLYAYVSTGTGSWLPFRLGCPAEITVFTLRRQA